MRDILFRGKRIDNGELVYGAYITMHHNDERTHIHHFIIPDGSDLSYGVKVEDILVAVDPETVCQYTGVTDKEGNKIFECDIVKTKFFGKCRGDVNFADYDIFQIVYEKGAFYFENSTRKFLVDERAKAEIIGNIFDNPELLEVSE